MGFFPVPVETPDFVLAAFNAKYLTPNSSNDSSGQGIHCSFYQQPVTDQIGSFNYRIFSCVGFDVLILLINYQSFANFVKHIKAKTLPFFSANKINFYQNYDKSLLCILKDSCVLYILHTILKDFILVDLRYSSGIKEFDLIRDLFRRSMKSVNSLAVYRIQNPRLWQKFGL